MPLLQWSEEQYASFKVRSAGNFLQLYMSHYPALIDELLISRIFWAWWCNQWLLRDEALLMQPGFANCELQNRVTYYKWLHSPENLIKKMVVDSVIFTDTSISKKPQI